MRLVRCKLLNEELPGLPQAPFPGRYGLKIYEEISAKAWQMWIEEQTRMLNEHRLDLSDVGDREWLFDVMIGFLFGDQQGHS